MPYKPPNQQTWCFKLSDPSGQSPREIATGIRDKRIATEMHRRVRAMRDAVAAGCEPEGDDVRWVRKHTSERLATILVQLGIVTRQQIGTRKPVAEHLADYVRELRALGRSQGYVSKQEKMVMVFLDSLAHVNQVTREGVLEVLGAIPGAHGHEHANATTKRTYLTALKAFIRWMVEAGRLDADPIPTLQTIKGAERRRIHYPLTGEELSRLYWATRDHERPRMVMSDGRERAALYLFAAHTGLRIGAIKQLTVADLDLEAEPACITVPASVDKGRKRRRLGIVDRLLLDDLGWLTGKRAPEERIFHNLPANIDFMDGDLRHAGISPRVDDVRVRDFHGLRATMATLMLRGGANIKTVQARLGHSSLKLTADVYSHALPDDELSALGSLPTVTATANK